MDANRFPRDLDVHTKRGDYIIRQLSDCAFLVKNWSPQCPLRKVFTLMGRQYLSDEPMTEERQEAINALLEALAKEDARA
jgi:hypothetical protein